MTTVTERTRSIQAAFRARFLDAGLVEQRPVPMSSGLDSSVRFIGASISALKPLLLTRGVPSSGVVTVQPCLRTHCLKSLADEASRYHWSSYFVQLGTLVPPRLTAMLARATFEFFLGDLDLPASRLVVRASSRDEDLSAAVSPPEGVFLEIDGYSQTMYRHRFGLEGWTGRNVNFAITCDDGIHDVGNLIIIEHAGTPIAVEVAFGLSVILCRIASLQHPIAASPIADHIPVANWPQIKCGNALEATVALAREGLRPVSRGRGRIFRDYLRALQILRPAAGLLISDVYRAAENCELILAETNVSAKQSASAIAAHLREHDSASLDDPTVHERALAAFDAGREGSGGIVIT